MLRHGPIDEAFARRLVAQFMQHARTRPAWRHLRKSAAPARLKPAP